MIKTFINQHCWAPLDSNTKNFNDSWLSSNPTIFLMSFMVLSSKYFSNSNFNKLFRYFYAHFVRFMIFSQYSVHSRLVRVINKNWSTCQDTITLSDNKKHTTNTKWNNKVYIGLHESQLWCKQSTTSTRHGFWKATIKFEGTIWCRKFDQSR